MALAWTEHLSVGNATIDSEHKSLIVMVNGIETMIKARDNFALPQAFEQLEHYLCAHFVDEENIARAVNFPFAKNKQEHDYVLKEFQNMKAELVAKDGIWSDGAAEHYSNFLSDWITDHVLKEDMLMKPALQNYPYDFKPDELNKQ
ncbi:MAG: hemerythrin domain-containing protein [Gallionella sp.]|nr:hemerythrin domain-containing protein [Gallionella sp.]